ncbi:MAG TPA: extracellular solute-binding protein [Anaerolineae bacterium]|nr:extracellular solute-binding protein [Anaerolineae bacterium]HQI86312.1 extracellular solute-binding protein [Anaerolineae bacterium]
MVDRNSPVPIYYQLKLHFKQQMEANILRPGDRLPTEMELCSLYDVSRAPIRQALTELAREGFLYRRAGQGTFVARGVSKRLERQTEVHVLTHYDVFWLGSMESAVHAWNLHHPDQEVKLKVTMCSRDDFHRQLRRTVAQGEAPDIVPMDYVWIPDYARAGYIAPLDKLDQQWAHELAENLEAPVARNNTVDGQLYGVPVQADVSGLWYRRDWFEAEGAAPPETWDDWLAMIDHFALPDVQRRYHNQYAVVFPVGAAAGEALINLLIPFLWTAGTVSSDDEARLQLDDPAVEKALCFLQRISVQRRNCLPPDVVHFHWWDFTDRLAKGIVPMTLGGTYEWPRIQDESDWTEEEDAIAHLGFIPAPRPTTAAPQAMSLGGTTWAIMQQSSEGELCAEILKQVSTLEALQAYCEEHLQISPHRTVNANLSSGRHPWLKRIIPFLELARPRPFLSNYLQASLFLQDMLQKILWEDAPIGPTIQRTKQALALLL